MILASRLFLSFWCGMDKSLVEQLGELAITELAVKYYVFISAKSSCEECEARESCKMRNSCASKDCNP